jgi:hypothetical protein
MNIKRVRSTYTMRYSYVDDPLTVEVTEGFGLLINIAIAVSKINFGVV